MGYRSRLKIASAVAVAVAVAVVVALWWQERPGERQFVTGAVLTANPDPLRQRPIADARIAAVAGDVTAVGRTDESGLFRVTLDPTLTPDQRITLTVEHPDYHTFEAADVSIRQLFLIRLTPSGDQTASVVEGPPVTIANVRVRYAFKAETTVEVASAARTFEVVNAGNTPCNDHPPCSPDRRWKAAVGTTSLDAGENRRFRNARVSCLAGPCPFTRVESNAFSQDGRVINVSVLNWADTVTYLVEAEVAQTMVSDLVRHSYPVIFGSFMNFTLPSAAQGPSIEAEVDGEPIVFPLGPRLGLSWATCRLDTGADHTRLYRCELKPGYLFKT